MMSSFAENKDLPQYDLELIRALLSTNRHTLPGCGVPDSGASPVGKLWRLVVCIYDPVLTEYL